MLAQHGPVGDCRAGQLTWSIAQAWPRHGFSMPSLGCPPRFTCLSPFTSWHKMKYHMIGYFLPPNLTQVLYQRLQTLRQGDRCVDEYTEEFHYLVARNDIKEKMKSS